MSVLSLVLGPNGLTPPWSPVRPMPKPLVGDLHSRVLEAEMGNTVPSLSPWTMPGERFDVLVYTGPLMQFQAVERRPEPAGGRLDAWA